MNRRLGRPTGPLLRDLAATSGWSVTLEPMRSRIHPTFKAKYRVKNWCAYDRALVRRGEALIACNVLNRMLELGRPASVAIRA